EAIPRLERQILHGGSEDVAGPHPDERGGAARRGSLHRILQDHVRHPLHEDRESLPEIAGENHVASVSGSFTAPARKGENTGTEETSSPRPASPPRRASRARRSPSPACARAAAPPAGDASRSRRWRHARRGSSPPSSS